MDYLISVIHNTCIHMPFKKCCNAMLQYTYNPIMLLSMRDHLNCSTYLILQEMISCTTSTQLPIPPFHKH